MASLCLILNPYIKLFTGIVVLRDENNHNDFTFNISCWIFVCYKTMLDM